MDETNLPLKKIIICMGAFIFSVFLYAEFVNPTVNVYQNKKHGEAELVRAESTRHIKVLEAQAIKESAQSLADAEVLRAIGVAKANAIIGESLKGNDGYLHYLFLEVLKEGKNQVIYIPTEASLPIIEASGNRLNNLGKSADKPVVKQ